MDIFKKNKKFYYLDKREVTDREIISRLEKIRVPPAWQHVRFASKSSSHVQVCGVDSGGKKQYILSENWINRSRTKKYNRLRSFINDLKTFKKKIKLPSHVSCFDKETLIHLLFNLLIDTHIRVGNEKYAKHHSTYGLTTMRQKHVIFKDNTFSFSFVGKSKIKHTVAIPEEYNSYLRLLYKPEHKNQCIFLYNNNTLSSEELNDYLKQHMGEYTCKDFRTYSANIVFIKMFLKKLKTQPFKPEKLIIESIDESARSLGNSRTICKKSYISNNLLDYCSGLKKPDVSYASLVDEI